MTGAAIGASVLGSAMTADAASDASSASSASSAQATATMREAYTGMQNFNQDILDDWEASFGGIEDNLTDYYSNLDPEKFAMASKQELFASVDKQLSQFKETMASQGLQTSGMRVQADKEAAFAKATGAAEIDINAPEQVSQMQQSWLASNAQEKANAIAGVNTSYSHLTGVAQSQQIEANTYSQSAAGYATTSGELFGTALSLGVDNPSVFDDMWN